MHDMAIEVDDLQKSYEGHLVLRGLSFAVRAGEIFGIAGRNGAGKTTTVEMLQGLRSRDRGTVRILGLDPQADRGRLRPLIGSQLQTAALPDRLRVGEALRLFARLAGDVVNWSEMANAWQLRALLGRPFATLSGGERQRLLLALALINRPRIVFLDELTQGLDPAARREAWRLVQQARDQGVTVVLVTHDLDEAERLCDRLAVIAHGRLLTCGRPAELASTAGPVKVRFSSPSAAALAGLERIPGVAEVGYDGRLAAVATDARAVVAVAAELSRRRLEIDDFTVVRPTLEDAVVAMLEGGGR